MTHELEPHRMDGADLPPLTENEVEALVRGHRPVDAAPGVDRTADVLHALAGPGARSELTGHPEVMAAYADAFATRRAGRPARRVLLSSLLGARTLAGAAGAALAAGVVGAVVLTGSALGPAHAPRDLPLAAGSTSTTASATRPPDAATEDGGEAGDTESGEDRDKATGQPGSTATAVGPDATGPAAFGLCNAWSHHHTAGPADAAHTSVAFRNLAEAAGGEGRIAAYCAKVPHPGKAGHDAKESPSQGKGQGNGQRHDKGQGNGQGNGQGSGQGKHSAEGTKPAVPSASPHTSPSRPTGAKPPTAPKPSSTTPGRPSVTTTS